MSSSTPPSAPLRKLPVLETFRKTYRAVFIEHLRWLPKASVAPLILYIAIIALPWAINFRAGASLVPGAGEAEVALSPAMVALNLLIIPLSFVPYVLFSVAWHRLILLGPEAGRPTLLPRWRQRHWRSLGYVILVILMGYGLILLALIPLAIVWAVVAIGASGAGSTALDLAIFAYLLLLLTLLGYFYARWSLVFPALAVDEAFGLRDSWRLTRGQALRVMMAAVLVMLPYLLAMLVAGPVYVGLLAVAGSAMGTGGMALSSLVGLSVLLLLFAYLAIAYLGLALMVTLVTVAFRLVSGWVPPTQAIADAFR